MSDMQEATTSGQECSPSEEPDLSDTFATVWVKVEVEEADDDCTLPTDVVTPIEEQTKQTKKRRPPANRKTLFCEKCEYKTFYRNCLKAHLLGHSNERPYSCTFCPYATIHSAALNRHVLMTHPEETGVVPPTFQCPACDYKTPFKSNLKSHSRKHLSEKNFKCAECNYATAYKHTLKKHEKIHRGRNDIVYRCEKCPFETKFDGHIKRHLAVIHNEILDGAKICELCGFVTKLNWRLGIHKRRSLGKQLLKCEFEQCDFETYYTCQYKRHKKAHLGNVYLNGKVINESVIRKMEHNVTQDDIIIRKMERNVTQDDNKLESNESQDDICDAINEKSDNQDTSEDLEASDPPVNTDEAENSDVELEGQDKHEKKHHYVTDPECLDWHSIQVLESSDKEKPYKCLLCDYTSKFKATVQRHFQRNHTSSTARPYKCVNCDFSTKTKDQIALHDNRSKSPCAVRCKLCPFTTNYKCKLVMHRKSHYEYKCSQCDYSCSQKYALAKHYNTYHLGIGFKCQYCDYKGTRKESVEAHVASIHTGNKPFKCSLCDYSALRLCILETHFKKHHSDVHALFMRVGSEVESNLSDPMNTNAESGYGEFSGQSADASID